MRGRVEERPGRERDAVAVEHVLDEWAGVGDAGEARERDRRPRQLCQLELRMRGEEIARAVDVGAENLSRPLREPWQQAEGVRREQIRRRRARVVDDVSHPADAFGDSRGERSPTRSGVQPVRTTSSGCS